MTEKTFIASDEAFGSAMEFIENELERVGCPIKVMMTVTVCFEEMFVNVAHYAYGDGNGEVTVSTDYSDGVFSITLDDGGIPFDPLSVNDPDITLSADERRIGGLGIFMVKKSMDNVSYKRENDRNIFRMEKKF